MYHSGTVDGSKVRRSTTWIHIYIYTYIKPCKYWNIYDINWWSPDFWTINYTYKLLTPWYLPGRDVSKPFGLQRLPSSHSSHVNGRYQVPWWFNGQVYMSIGPYLFGNVQFKYAFYNIQFVCVQLKFLGGHDIYCVCCKNFILPGTFGMGLFGLYSMPTDEHLEYEYNGQSWDEE